MKIEIHGTNGALMLARPVGNAQGMGAMGFCYSPYHFVMMSSHDGSDGSEDAAFFTSTCCCTR